MQEQAKTEAEMRDAGSVWPQNAGDLISYIKSLVEREHDYGTAVYAMSMAANAAFNYVSHELGATGFQASCADLDFLRRTRMMKGPFIILKADELLYPQYNLEEKLAEFKEGCQKWVKEQATLRLSENLEAHPKVKEHWEKLSKMEIKGDENAN